MTGFVSLVGAGPGDPDLLTLKAARRLRAADLVLYDALVGPELISFASNAQRFCVGKRSGRKSINQATIERLMVRSARRGKRVVRLKCGDPFVLGRGGEEALALLNAGVPFEVVPGLTSAVAAPELAGFPVTHRGLAAGFVVVSGHAESVYGPILDNLAPQSLTIIILMGLASRPMLSKRLLRNGWPPNTPAAIILAAGTRNMQTWSGRLDELGTTPVESGVHLPGTIVIGDVVGLRSLPSIELAASAVAFGS
jgi:uroporphyrin-III C-methyltransferase/precorrin-2 dehydrogenase/sirohydrochlorin ferrochelatase